MVKAAWSLSFVVTSDAGHSIERLGNRDGENTTLARIESLTPLPIPLCKIGNRAGLPLKSGDAPLHGRLGKRQVPNLSLPIAVGYAGNCGVNNSAELAATLHAKHSESRVGLVCRRRECPNLTSAKPGRGRGGLLGARAKEEGEQTHNH